MKLAVVGNPPDHFMYVIGGAHIGRDDSVKLLRIEPGRPGRRPVDAGGVRRPTRAHNVAHDQRRMPAVFGDMIDYARPAALRLCPAQPLPRYLLTRRRLHPPPPRPEDPALVSDHTRPLTPTRPTNH